MPPPVDIDTTQGLFLPGVDLWLDPPRVKSWAFVSHAHADHFRRHERILCSPATATILRARYNVAEQRLDPLPFNETREIDGFQLRLFPAGHIFGSAMIHVTRISDGASLLYTGDFKVRRSLTSEEPVFRQADTLVMETTFGRPEFVFPSETDVHGSILNFVHECFDAGQVPVLLAYSLGKAQEALAILAQAAVPALQSAAVAKMTAACRKGGCELPEPVPFEDQVPDGHVLVCPSQTLRSKAFAAVRNPRTAILSGWAMNPSAIYRYGVDAAIPLSDHADFPGLLEAVRRVSPQRVITVHGYTRDFAAVLRRQQIDAWSVDGGDQLEFLLQV